VGSDQWLVASEDHGAKARIIFLALIAALKGPLFHLKTAVCALLSEF
jgi:hypothetical protein